MSGIQFSKPPTKQDFGESLRNSWIQWVGVRVSPEQTSNVASQYWQALSRLADLLPLARSLRRVRQHGQHELSARAGVH